NGAISHSTPDYSRSTDGRLALFGCLRNTDHATLKINIDKALEEDIVDTFILAFHLRDIRGGKGEREMGRKAFLYLTEKMPQIMTHVVDKIPEYGRWDDLLSFSLGNCPLSTRALTCM